MRLLARKGLRTADVVAMLGLAGLLLATGCSRQKPEAASTERGPTERSGEQDTTGWQAQPSASPAAVQTARAGEVFNLILLSLDTTRRDHLSCYGFPKKTTPNLDQLAAEGILFEQSTTPVPITLPAHTCMLTGLYPFQHGVRNNGNYALSPDRVTLAELLREQGYQTCAILGAFPLDHRFGLSQGFDHYDDFFPGASQQHQGDFTQRPAADVTQLSLDWIEAHQEKAFFLWAHYFDPHAPYAPPEPYLSRFAGDKYAGEIAAMDAAIGELVQGLQSRKLLERTVIIVTGDHGEGLGEHDELTHTVFIYESTQRVPFILRLPRAGRFADDLWRGRRIGGLASLVDLLPTAWDALGFAAPAVEGLAGTSLLPAVQAGTTGHPWVYHESLVPNLEYGASELRGLQVDRWKYIRAPRPELYDLEVDPGELTNLAGKQKARLQTMEAQLATILVDEPAGDSQQEMDQETVAKLRSLGYVAGAGTRTGQAENLMDPKDLKEIPITIARAEALSAQQRTAEALALVDSLLAAHPRIPKAQLYRGSYLNRLDRSQEAITALDKALADCQGCPDQLQLSMERALAAMKSGDLNDALTRTQTLLAKHPQEATLHLLLGEILQQQGDWDGAREAFRAETRLFPRDVNAWIKLGFLEQSRQQSQQAEQALRRALAINPHNTDAMVMLSETLDRTGRQQEAASLVDQALAASPGHPGANYRKGESLLENGQYEEALRHFQLVLSARPGDPHTLFNMGMATMSLGQLDRAEKFFKDTIATGKAAPEVYADLGVVYGRMGRYQDAIEQWNRAIAMDPQGRAVPTIRQNIQAAQKEIQKSSRQPR